MSKPRLAAFAGFHGTMTALHRAIKTGDDDMCRLIVDMCQKYSDRQRAKCVGVRDTLLHTVVNQRSHKGLTPLMMACEKGCVSFELKQGSIVGWFVVLSPQKMLVGDLWGKMYIDARMYFIAGMILLCRCFWKLEQIHLRWIYSTTERAYTMHVLGGTQNV